MLGEYKEKGALLEADLIEKKIKEGLWEENKEKKLNKLETDIRIMSESKKKAAIPSQLLDIEEVIEGFEKQRRDLLLDRSTLTSLSAETLTRSALTEFIVHLSFYKDFSCSENLFSLEDVIDFSREELWEVVSEQTRVSYNFGAKSLRKISVSSVIRDFIKSSNGPESFFGKSGYLLTLNQVHLFEYGKYFTSLIEQLDLSYEDKQDPDEIERQYLLKINNKKEENPDKTRGKLINSFAKAENKGGI